MHQDLLPDGHIFSAYQHNRLGMIVAHRPWSHVQGAFALHFGVVPDDNDGKPHIAEHMIFRGSRELPFKEPLSVYSRWSPALEINAQTTPQEVCLYASSSSASDLRDIFRINVDAAFFPLMRPAAFLEEVSRLVKTVSGERHALTGVVLNEMRGDYDQPVELFSIGMMRALFPDTYFAYDYGGDPNRIPLLSLESLVRWMEPFFHPANAVLTVTGNAVLADFLEEIDRVSHYFAPKVIPNMAVQQAPLSATKLRDIKCAGVNTNSTSINQPLIGFGIARKTAESVGHRVTCQILDHALAVRDSSPLNDHLSAELPGYSLGGCSLPPAPADIFMTSACGVSGLGHKRFERIVCDGLAISAGDENMPRLLSRSVAELRRYAATKRESPTGPSEIAVEIAREIGSSNSKGEIESSFAGLVAVDEISAINRAAELFSEDDKLAKRLIEQELLDNPHRAVVRVRPDHRVNGKICLREKARIEELLKTRQPEEITYHQAGRRESKSVVSDFRERFDQSEPVAPLRFESVPTDDARVSVFRSAEATQCHACVTISLRGVAFEHVPAFAWLLFELPAQLSRHDLDADVTVGCEFQFVERHGEILPVVIFHATSEPEHVDRLWELLERLINAAPLPAAEEIHALLETTIVEHREALIQSPSTFALRRAGARANRCAAIDELVCGLAYERELSAMLQKDSHALHALLKYFQEWLAAQTPIGAAIVAPNFCLPPLGFIKRVMATNTSSSPVPPWIPSIPMIGTSSERRETVPYLASVGALGVVIPFDIDPAYGNVVAHYLRTVALQDRVRRRAGAYKFSANFDAESRVLEISVGDVREFERAELEVGKALEDLGAFEEQGVFEAIRNGAAAYLVNGLEIGDRLAEEMLFAQGIRTELPQVLAERILRLSEFPLKSVREQLEMAFKQAYWVRIGALAE